MTRQTGAPQGNPAANRNPGTTPGGGTSHDVGAGWSAGAEAAGDAGTAGRTGPVPPRSVAVIGAGTMGHGIARVFAAGGVPVRLADRTVELARAGRDAIAAGLPERDATVVDLVTPVGDIAEAVTGAALVIEAVPEDLALKQVVWQAIGAHAPRDATLASNTSSYDIGLLATAAGAPARVLGMHWYNPAYLVPCVEVVRTAAVEPGRVEAVLGWLTALGKRPAVTANTAGFVGNRLQFAMVAEAFRCLAEGVATAPDIDAIVRSSFGFRLGDYGPFEIADLAGLDVYRAILDYLAEHLGERFATPPNLVELTAAGRYGAKSGRGVYEWPGETARRARADRDRRLAARLNSIDAGGQNR